MAAAAGFVGASLRFTRFDLGEVHHRLGHEIQIVRQEVQGDVRDRLDDLGVGEFRGTRGFELALTDVATLHDDAAGEIQDGSGAFIRGNDLAGIVQLLLTQARFTAEIDMGAAAVAAIVDLSDSERDLVTHFFIENTRGESAAEIEIGAERGRGIAEDAEEIRDDAQLGLHTIEELLGLAGGLSGVELSDTVHIVSFVCLFQCCVIAAIPPPITGTVPAIEES